MTMIRKVNLKNLNLATASLIVQDTLAVTESADDSQAVTCLWDRHDLMWSYPWDNPGISLDEARGGVSGPDPADRSRMLGL